MMKTVKVLGMFVAGPLIPRAIRHFQAGDYLLAALYVPAIISTNYLLSLLLHWELSGF